MIRMAKDIRCDCCNLEFKKGVQIPVVSYEDHRGLFGKWKIVKRRRKIYICEKCKNTAEALVRNHLAIKTTDIIGR